MRLAGLSTLLFLVLPACGGGTAVDAGPDLSLDLAVPPDLGPRDLGPPDLGATCSPACSLAQLCCGPSGGAGTCVDMLSDPDNCGECGLRCADGHGTACVASHCVCGLTDVGCLGATDNLCCPPQTDGGMSYCANLLTDSADCSSCGHACDQHTGGNCNGGHCYCGTLDRTSCTGTPSSLCCVDLMTGQGTCADTTSDQFNCGGCNIQCQVGETCRGGQCSIGTETCTSCDHTAEVCCHGVCCGHTTCLTGVCGPPDAGVAADASVTDGSSPG